MATPEKKPIKWVNVFKDMSTEGIIRSFLSKREYDLAKDVYAATKNDDYMALAITVRDRIIERWINTQQRYHKTNVKRVYYLSLEFLIGRLLGTNMQNLGMWEAVRQSLADLGLDIEELRNMEADAGLGNGGLGRLAACFLDSMATLGIPAVGYGIRYEFGIFNQKIINGAQAEYPDAWLTNGNPWELNRLEYTTKIHFYGRTYSYTDEKGRFRVKWVETEDILAHPYDTPVVGYRNEVVNTLRLWAAHATNEFDFRYFNDGDYERAVYNRVFSENISKVLYPNDNVHQGKELRLKQEYFFTAASISDIIRRFRAENSDFRTFPDKVAIQLNDTHPALAIVELMRLLIDEYEYEWDVAWSIVTKTFAYTNHTVMPEALETWPVPMLERMLPRHLQIIYEINFRFLREVATQFPNDIRRLERMSIIEEGSVKRVRMAFLSIVGSHSVNGVSQLHSTLLQSQLFKDFYELWPARFNNKTNGITPRRWLQKSNNKLSDLISSRIGESWKHDFPQLETILKYKNDPQFQEAWRAVKHANKQILSAYIKETTGIVVNENSLFDVQVKRIHEYKRQLLFAFYIIAQYLKIKHDPHATVIPRTFMVGGKAAPGYFMAKLIIRFINSVADVINNDPRVKDLIKVVFLENYRVSLAEKVFPASDLSEQISTAGTEASGTGCMKFMMNGALTIGTLDGANIEIVDAVGKENAFIFGLTVADVERLQREGYNPREYIRRSPVLHEIYELIRNNFFSPIEFGLFSPLIGSLTSGDQYFVCADFDSYCAAQEKVSAAYADAISWTEKSIVNVAKSHSFSSDRTIAEYAKDIWNIQCSPRKM